MTAIRFYVWRQKKNKPKMKPQNAPLKNRSVRQTHIYRNVSSVRDTLYKISQDPNIFPSQ